MGVPFDDSVPVTDDRPPWQQPRLIVGLSVVAALVLTAGLVVAFAGGGDDRVATVDPTAMPTTPAVASTTTDRASSTTTSAAITTTTTAATTAATTTTTTTTTTEPPEPAVANAGDDRAVSFGETVTLAALDLGDPDQSVVFRQIGGPDVTGGAGRFVGNGSAFTAPTETPST